MSSPHPVVVNCGATHVSVSVFSAQAGRLKLEKFQVQELGYNYANEDEWLGALTNTLRALIRTMKLSGSAATVIVPGYKLLTKNIKVPQVEKSRQQQIIAFEAQNNLPYKLHEMVWGSQIISTDGVEAEVALFALKSEEAVRFTNAIASTGVKPVVVQAATLLDYQAYRLAAGEITEDVLLVNIGARSTNLTFVSPSGFSIQNAGIGGNNLTQSISDHIGKPFQAAEQLKTTFFSNPGQHGAHDPMAEILGSNAQAFARRLSQDITRRIVNYKRQNQGRAPAKILLTGRASLLPGLSEQLCESQKISVEYFDPSSVLVPGPGVNAQALEYFRFQMSESVGEAARLLLPDPVGVNLVPGEIAESMAFAKKKPFFIAAALLFAVAPWPACFVLNNWSKSVEKSRALISREVNDYRKNQNEIKVAEESAKQLSARVQGFSFVEGTRNDWGNFLARLQASILKEHHVWIETMEVRRKQLPVVDGKPAYASPATEVRIKVRVLMQKSDIMEGSTNTETNNLATVAPDAAFDGSVTSARFKAVRAALMQKESGEKEHPFIKSIRDEKMDFDQANLPAQTFILQIQPQVSL